MSNSFSNKYLGTQNALKEAYFRGELTNPKQPVEDRTPGARRNVDARYLSWDLSKSTSAYGLDARTINENIRGAITRRDWNASSTIEGIVDSLSRGAARTKGAYEAISATGLPRYWESSQTHAPSQTEPPSYGPASMSGPSGYPSTSTTLGTRDATGRYETPSFARYGSGAFGPN